MNERFERYNEITFEAYCKAAIDNAVHRGVRKKERRAELEPPLTELNDAVLFRLDPTDAPQEAVLDLLRGQGAPLGEGEIPCR